MQTSGPLVDVIPRPRHYGITHQSPLGDSGYEEFHNAVRRLYDRLNAALSGVDMEAEGLFVTDKVERGSAKHIENLWLENHGEPVEGVNARQVPYCSIERRQASTWGTVYGCKSHNHRVPDSVPAVVRRLVESRVAIETRVRHAKQQTDSGDMPVTTISKIIWVDGVVCSDNDTSGANSLELHTSRGLPTDGSKVSEGRSKFCQRYSCALLYSALVCYSMSTGFTAIVARHLIACF